MTSKYKRIASNKSDEICFQINNKANDIITFEEINRTMRPQLHSCWDKNCFMISKVFKTTTRRNYAFCKYCQEVMEGRPTELYKHIAACSKVLGTIKVQYMLDNNKLISDDDACLSTTTQPCTTGIEQTPSSVESVSTNVKSMYPVPSMQTSLSGYVRTYTKELILTLHILLLKAIITSATSFSILDNPYFIEYQRTLAGNKAYPIPSYYYLIQDLLPQLYAEVILRHEKVKKIVRDFTLSIDGVTDESGKIGAIIIVVK